MAITGLNNPVNLFMPGMAETQVGLSNIERQRALAQAMQQQAMTPPERFSTNGIETPISWTQGLSKILQGYAGGQQQSALDQKQLALVHALAGKYSGLFGSDQAATPSASALDTALANGKGPTQENADALAQMTPRPRPGPLQMPGVDSNTSMARFAVSPDKYMEALYKDQERSQVDKTLAALGVAKGSPEYIAAQRKLLTKETHTPLDIVRQNSVALGPEGNVSAYNPPPIPGAFPQFQGGMPTGYAQAPGAQQIMAGNAAATSGGQAAGKAPYETQVLNTEGAPTLMTQEQAIQAATGQPMPQPGQQQQGQQLPPGVPQSDAAAYNFVRQQDRRGVPASANMQGPGGTLQKNVQVPGLRLQDQGESARQKSYGTERGQLEAAQPQAGIQARTTLANIERLASVAGELETHPGLSGITGKVNQYSTLDVMPETRAARALQGTLVKQAAVSTLQSMRDASKSGGAVGQVTEKEWPILEQQLAALDSAQTTADYKVALRNLQNQMNGAAGRIKAAYEETYSTALPYKSIPYESQQRGATKGGWSIRPIP